MYGKIEPSQAVYSFKDQVLISCDTGYKVLKVKNAAWEGEPVGQKTSASQVFPSILLHFPKTPDIQKGCIPSPLTSGHDTKVVYQSMCCPEFF